METGEFLLALGQKLVVGIFRPVGGDCERFEAHIKADNGPSAGERVYLHIGTAQSDKIFAAGVLADGGREDAAFDLFGNTALHKANLRNTDMIGIQPNISLVVRGLKRFPAVMFLLKTRIAWLLSVFDAAEEILISRF